MSIHVDPKKLVIAKKLRQKGMTTISIAEALGVSEPTASRWSRGMARKGTVRKSGSGPNRPGPA